MNWLIFGIVLGVAIGAGFVIGQNVDFDRDRPSDSFDMTCEELREEFNSKWNNIQRILILEVMDVKGCNYK